MDGLRPYKQRQCLEQLVSSGSMLGSYAKCPTRSLEMIGHLDSLEELLKYNPSHILVKITRKCKKDSSLDFRRGNPL